MNIFKCIISCMVSSAKITHGYTLSAEIKYVGEEHFIPLYGVLCVSKTENTLADEFVRFDLRSFSLYLGEDHFVGTKGNLRFHQHSPGNYHNEGYSFQSGDGNFSMSNDDVGTPTKMEFATPPYFINFSNGGSGVINGRNVTISDVTLVRTTHCSLD